MKRKKWNILLVEPFDGSASSTCVLVGVRPLPVLEVKCRLGEVVEGVLDLGLRGNVGLVSIVVLDLLLLRLLLLGLLLLGGSRCLLLLWWDELHTLLSVVDGAVDLL